jgi:hypothetical protein
MNRLADAHRKVRHVVRFAQVEDGTNVLLAVLNAMSASFPRILDCLGKRPARWLDQSI